MTRAYVYTVLPSLFVDEVVDDRRLSARQLQDCATAIAAVWQGTASRFRSRSRSNRRARRSRRSTSASSTTRQSPVDDLRQHPQCWDPMSAGVRRAPSARRIGQSAETRPCGLRQPVCGTSPRWRRWLHRRPDVGPDGNDYEKVDITARRDSRPRRSRRPRRSSGWLTTCAARWPHGSIEGDVPHLSRRRTSAPCRSRFPPTPAARPVAARPDGARLGMNEQREARAAAQRRSDHPTLNKGAKQLALRQAPRLDAGVIVNGELLSALPPSVLGVLEGSQRR